MLCLFNILKSAVRPHSNFSSEERSRSACATFLMEYTSGSAICHNFAWGYFLLFILLPCPPHALSSGPFTTASLWTATMPHGSIHSNQCQVKALRLFPSLIFFSFCFHNLPLLCFVWATERALSTHTIVFQWLTAEDRWLWTGAVALPILNISWARILILTVAHCYILSCA